MGYRPRKCSRTNALERQGPRRWPKAWATDRCQFTGSRRDSDEGRDLLQVSPRLCGQAGPRTQTLMGSHGVPSPTEGQDLAEQREGGCSVPAQTDRFQASLRQGQGTYVLADRSLQCLVSRHLLTES